MDAELAVTAHTIGCWIELWGLALLGITAVLLTLAWHAHKDSKA